MRIGQVPAARSELRGGWRAAVRVLLAAAAFLLAACGSSANGAAPTVDAVASRGPRRDAGAHVAADASPGCGRDAGRDAHVVDARRDVSRDGGLARDASLMRDATKNQSRDATAASDVVDAGSVEAGAADVETARPDDCPPELTDLDVSPLELEPAFSPSIHDYALRCATGVNAVQVAVTASAGALTAFERPVVSPMKAQQTLSLGLREDDAVVIDVSVGGVTSSYWVRCLPHDFPELKMTLHPEAGTPPPGYYFIGNHTKAGAPAPDGGYAMVIDAHGTPVWYAKTHDNAGAKDVDLRDSNTISFIPVGGYTTGTYQGSWALHALSPVGLRYVTAVRQPIDTHELAVRKSNGNYLFFVDQIDYGVDLTALNTDSGGMRYSSNEDVVDCVLEEVTPSGALVWQWVSSQHIDFEREMAIAETVNAVWADASPGPPPNDAGKVIVRDPIHCNALDFDPDSDDGDGNILISARNTDALFYIQHDAAHRGTPEDGKILWKLGGKPYSKDGARLFTVANDPYGGFHGQHHIRYQRDGSRTLTVFDNHTQGTGPARGVEFVVDTDAGTASILWEYDFPLGATSAGMGSFTLLADGSRVIGWGHHLSGIDRAFTEVDVAKHDLLDFYFPNNPEATYRALKFTPSDVDIEVLRRSVGSWSSTRLGLPTGGDDGGGAGRDAHDG